VALELATFVKILANEMQLDEFAVVENEIFSSILNLMHSSDSNNRLGGVVAISALINVTSADEEKKATKFAKNLGHGWRANNADFQYLSAVTKAFGKMAVGNNSADYIECELPKAIEFLRKDRSDRRLAAVLILKELSHSAPAAFYSKIERQQGSHEYINELFPILLDPQPIVRVCAADALAEYLKILVDPTRQHHSTTLNLCQVFGKVMKGFNYGKSKGNMNGSNVLSQNEIEAAQHASLLVVGDLIDLPLDFMLPRFDTVCKAVLALKAHQKELIQLEVIRLIVSHGHKVHCKVFHCNLTSHP
jgi:FKBP12-rapamycin complex-associated protein